jgi:hypothetical protein
MAENYCELKEDGSLGHIGPLPKSRKNISGFHLLDDAKLKTYGWLPMLEVVVPYDQETHHRGHPIIDIQVNQVVFTDNVIAFTAQEIKENKWSSWISEMSWSDNRRGDNPAGMAREIEDLMDIVEEKFPNVFDAPKWKPIKDRRKAKRDLRETKP